MSLLTGNSGSAIRSHKSPTAVFSPAWWENKLVWIRLQKQSGVWLLCYLLAKLHWSVTSRNQDNGDRELRRCKQERVTTGEFLLLAGVCLDPRVTSISLNRPRSQPAAPCTPFSIIVLPGLRRDLADSVISLVTLGSLRAVKGHFIFLW